MKSQHDILDSTNKLLVKQVDILKERVLNSESRDMANSIYDIISAFQLCTTASTKILIDSACSLLIINSSADSHTYLNALGSNPFTNKYLMHRTPWLKYYIDNNLKDVVNTLLETRSDGSLLDVNLLNFMPYIYDRKGTYSYLNMDKWVPISAFNVNTILKMFESFTGMGDRGYSTAYSGSIPASTNANIHYKETCMDHLFAKNTSIRAAGNNKSYMFVMFEILNNHEKYINMYCNAFNKGLDVVNIEVGNKTHDITFLELAFIRCLHDSSIVKNTSYMRGHQDYSNSLYEEVECDCAASQDDDYECDCDRDLCHYLDEFKIGNNKMVSSINIEGEYFG